MTDYAPHPGHPCPTCKSPAPHQHPAVQCEGEVQVCRDTYHLTPTNQNVPAFIAEVQKARAKEPGFQDANGVTVRPPDEVQHQFGARHGTLVSVFPDGDAYVKFFDAPERDELVKWKHLCGVPAEHRQGVRDQVADYRRGYDYS